MFGIFFFIFDWNNAKKCFVDKNVNKKIKTNLQLNFWFLVDKLQLVRNKNDFLQNKYEIQKKHSKFCG